MNAQNADSGVISGCYICQPDNPDAAPEGCVACEMEFAEYARRQWLRQEAAQNGSGAEELS